MCVTVYPVRSGNEQTKHQQPLSKRHSVIKKKTIRYYNSKNRTYWTFDSIVAFVNGLIIFLITSIIFLRKKIWIINHNIIKELIIHCPIVDFNGNKSYFYSNVTFIAFASNRFKDTRQLVVLVCKSKWESSTPFLIYLLKE